jgi:hypothetical protein
MQYRQDYFSNIIFVSCVETQFPVIAKNWRPPHHQRNQAITVSKPKGNLTTVKYRNGIPTAANPLTGFTDFADSNSQSDSQSVNQSINQSCLTNGWGCSMNPRHMPACKPLW